MSFGITKKTLIKEEQMQFIKFITITVVLLSTSLVFAEGEVSTSVMNSEIKKGIIENPDGSFTIYEPRMLRGNKEMPIYGAEGICTLFGFNKYLIDSGIQTEETTKSIWLNEDGSFGETVTDRKPYKEITCYNDGDEIISIGTYCKNCNYSEIKKGITNNPDGSVTIYEPRMLRGNTEMPLYNNYGICALFGFNKYLIGSGIKTEQAVAKAIYLKNDGSYHQTVADEHTYTEITCANEGEFKAIPKAAEITNNPDGSATVSEPRILRGNTKMPIYGAEGICTLFGFNKYLIDSGIQTEETTKSIWLNEDGSFGETVTDRKPYKEITCYNDGDEIISIGTYCKNCN